MATATTTAEGLNKTEMKLLNDFSNTVNALEYTDNLTVDKLVLSYTKEDGFTIDILTTANQIPES